MVGRLRVVIAVVLVGISSLAYAQEKIRVVILPFEIHSLEDRSYLQSEIPQILAKHLILEGAVVVPAQPAPGADFDSQAADPAEIRKVGIKNDADAVVWGSLTWIGARFSLDVRLARTFDEKAPQVFSMEGAGVENLPQTLKKLSEEISLKLFAREKVAEIRVKGQQRIEEDAIARVIQTKPGDVFLARSLSEDLKAIYAMGYFDDIRIEAENGPDGKIITFNVVEKATIREIRIKGNQVYDDEEIKENLTIRTGSILNIFKIRNNIKRIEELYKDKNYHNVQVAYRPTPLENNQADLVFEIDEGAKVRIKQITFDGNTAMTAKKLKKVMKTSEKGFWSWLTSSGELNAEDLNQDSARLTEFYHNNGYIQARVGEPQVEFKENWIYITIKVDEGAQFKVGDVKVKGDLILPVGELDTKIKIAEQPFYSREVLRSDVLALSDLYADEGYAYADITPRIDKDFEKLSVHITYDIKKGKEVYFERIIIGGNTKTRDKVIRRQLAVYEQEIYSGKRLKRGVRNLHRLDYFEEVKVNTEKGSADDLMILKIDVTEKPTGAFSFGGGFSSVENFFGMASITQRNLFGRGQTLGLEAHIGGTTQKFKLSFTEPWLFDIPLSAGCDVYNWDTDYNDYEQDRIGGGVRFGYPVFDYTRAYLGYTYEVSDIHDIEAGASQDIRDLQGVNDTSSITTSLRYDSRDKLFNPSEGQNHSLTAEFAGGPLGGNIGFAKYTGEAGFYFPLFWGTVGFVHGKIGYIASVPGELLPDYERFYLGGINTLRGFDWREVNVREDGTNAEIGGDKMVLFNFEYSFPLIKEAGLNGVIFFDTGNVYGTSNDIDLGDMRETAGFGFRWYSPLGPIRLEWGQILDPKDDAGSGSRWEFTMGTAF